MKSNFANLPPTAKQQIREKCKNWESTHVSNHHCLEQYARMHTSQPSKAEPVDQVPIKSESTPAKTEPIDREPVENKFKNIPIDVLLDCDRYQGQYTSREVCLKVLMRKRYNTVLDADLLTSSSTTLTTTFPTTSSVNIDASVAVLTTSLQQVPVNQYIVGSLVTTVVLALIGYIIRRLHSIVRSPRPRNLRFPGSNRPESTVVITEEMEMQALNQPHITTDFSFDTFQPTGITADIVDNILF